MPVSGDVRLVEDLVARFPVFEDAYDAHVDNMDGVLPHVFFWDVTQDVVRSFVGQRPDATSWTGVPFSTSWRSSCAGGFPR
ncbi:hypothetical protein SAMN05428939_7661 [Streptomyces sp. TLI_105]|nr:hypothetical protein SAMN05428939_7661 [Streptomyces sp. TLI_105]